MKARRKRKKWSLKAYYAFIVFCTLLALLILTGYSTRAFRKFFIDSLKQSLHEQTLLVSTELRHRGITALTSELDQLCNELGENVETRFTVMLPNGVVICDSDADPMAMDNHRTRPEMLEALAGRLGSTIRFSNTVRAELLYVALPLDERGELVAVVRTGFPLTSINDHLNRLFYRLCFIAAIISGLFALTVFYFYRRMNFAFSGVREGAHRFARGQFDRRVPEFGFREIDDFAAAMNRMGAQLRHLEKVRSDFVANVSHELKTPITSIKGFVETLLDGAIENVEDRERFLRIIAKQSDRLTVIIEDLLTLARLESERVDQLMILQDEHVADLISAAVDICKDRAEEKGIVITTSASPDLLVKVDRSLLEQAIMNLVDNAIKYSERGTHVDVNAKREGNEVFIRVVDEGPGISEEHLSRIFERFYRVDKARSRTLGGTGLGLSIVKHVTAVHKGRVDVRSRPNEGSTFSIILPIPS